MQAEIRREEILKNNGQPRNPQSQRDVILQNIDGPKSINGQAYPKLVNGDKFVPIRKMIHLDLKGAPYKVNSNIISLKYRVF